jgi:hypothetical protein
MKSNLEFLAYIIGEGKPLGHVATRNLAVSK